MNACTRADAEHERRIAECRAQLVVAATSEERRRAWQRMREHLQARTRLQIMHLELERGLRK